MTASFQLLVAISPLCLAATLQTQAVCGEGPDRVCYGVNGGESQHLDVEDIQYVAEYLRYIGDQASGAGKFWQMPKAIDCAEWSLPVDDGGTVLALAKHIKPRNASAILYEDLATAIDGGKGATDGGKSALLGCGTNGGQYGAKANFSNPLYWSETYGKLGSTPDGILIKLVKAPKSK